MMKLDLWIISICISILIYDMIPNDFDNGFLNIVKPYSWLLASDINYLYFQINEMI